MKLIEEEIDVREKCWPATKEACKRSRHSYHHYVIADNHMPLVPVRWRLMPIIGSKFSGDMADVLPA